MSDRNKFLARITAIVVAIITALAITVLQDALFPKERRIDRVHDQIDDLIREGLHGGDVDELRRE